MPAITERCRTWTHTQATCEYFNGKQIPIPWETSINPLCSCATGIFRAEVHQLASWGLVNKANAIDAITMNGTRAAISPFFGGSWDDPEYGTYPDTRNTIKKARVPKQLKSITVRCEVCHWYVGVADAKECGRCRITKYCSRECQTKDWQHKWDCVSYSRMKEDYLEVLEIIIKMAEMGIIEIG